MSKCSAYYYEYLLVILYSIVTQAFLAITPLSFEDHFIWTQMLQIFIVTGLLLRFYNKGPLSYTRIYLYTFGFIGMHAAAQILLACFYLPICAFGYGMMWYLLLEIPTAFLLSSLCIFLLRQKYRWWIILVWVLIFILFFALMTLFDLLESPTLYFFHPTVGYYPGPLYDRWIPVSPNLLMFRFWTISMGLFFWALSKQYRVVFWALILSMPIFFRSDLGFRASHQTVQKQLYNRYETPLAHIFSYQQHLESFELASIDYYVTQICAQLQIPPPSSPVKIYIYGDPRLKKRLTGTHYTMIGNPRQRALHMLAFSAWDTLLIHELTHALSASMKDNILSLPFNPLQTEGLAMHVQASIGKYSLHQWAKAIARFREQTSITMINGLASFYTLPSTHAYALAGSWTSFLIDRYGLQKYKAYYAGSSLLDVYGQNIHAIEKQWFAYLDTVALRPNTYQEMLSSLQRKSVFKTPCPHETAHAQHQWENCKDQKCKQQWEKYALACNPQYSLGHPNTARPQPSLEELLSMDMEQAPPRKKALHYIKLAKQYELRSDFDTALSYINEAMATVDWSYLLAQRDRILFLSIAPAKKNPAQIKRRPQ